MPRSIDPPVLEQLRLLCGRPPPAHTLGPEWGNRPAAVLVPLYWQAGALWTLAAQRAPHLRVHAGQVSFPGGKPESHDRGPEDTALREAHEELGIEPACVDILGRLPICPTFVTGFLITPVVAWVPDAWAATPRTDEFDRVVRIRLADLLAPGALEVEWKNHAGARFPLYTFRADGAVVWGATARIVRDLLDLCAPLLPDPIASPG